VSRDGRLAGMVSICDGVKARLDEMEYETSWLWRFRRKLRRWRRIKGCGSRRLRPFALVLLVLASCAGDQPTFDQVSGRLLSPPANIARIFVYRAFAPYQSLECSRLLQRRHNRRSGRVR
jgi:hypothetical protein